jgi:TRAP-type C4-dicarboxylate transport system permease large subunit
MSLASALIGWLPGGIAIAALCSCAFFTALTGASGMTIVALGGLLYPILRQDGYPRPFSLGLLSMGRGSAEGKQEQPGQVCQGQETHGRRPPKGSHFLS